MEKPRFRFAPSPTGPIHLGNLRTALFNWLAARNMDGTFVLRIEDTDLERSTVENEQAIISAMLYLGLDWDEGPDTGGDFGPYRQSERKHFHDEALQQLLDLGVAYPCFCTADELEEKRKAVIAKGRPYRYDRACLADPDASRKRMEDGEPCSIRFKMPDEDIIVDDLVRGKTVFGMTDHSDFIIRRTDGSFTYNFVCVIDDAGMKISHVVRGEDHLSNTPKQIAIFHALEQTPPEYAHVPLIHSPEGGKLKKRDYGEGINWFSENGYLSNAMFNYLALLGWSHPDGTEFLSRQDIVDVFKLERISKSPSKFDIGKLSWLNEQHMRALDAQELYNAAIRILPEGEFKELQNTLGEECMKQALYELRDGYSNLREIPGKFGVFRDIVYAEELQENIDILMEDREINIGLLQALADEFSAVDAINDGDIAMHLMKSAGGKAGCKGKALFHPLRVALTGRDEGFEMKRLLPLLGKERILKRAEHVLGILKSE